MEVGNKSIAQLAEELNQIPFLEGLRPDQLLDKVPFFTGLPSDLLTKVAEQTMLFTFLPGKVICHKGDYEETFYIILAGQVDVDTETRANQTIHLADLGKGEFFGEMGPLSGQPRTATVTAREKTVVLQVPKGIFLEVLKKSPEVKQRIDKKYVERSLRTHLKQVNIFTALPDDVLDILANQVQLLSFKKGEVIIKEGDPADCLYLVRSGFVKVSRGPLDHDKILTYLRDGNYFGEMALVHDERRSANVVAITDVEAVKIGKKEFQGILGLYPEVAAQITATMSARERESQEIQKDDRLARAMSFVVQKGLAQAREILTVDLEQCVGCDNCVMACEAAREHSRLERRGSRLGRFLVPASCFHCENPECLLCSVGGIVRDKDGEIHFTENCVGCGRCAKRCPFGNILIVKLDDEEGKKPGRRRGPSKSGPPGEGDRKRRRQIVVKCDMCTDYKRMACVFNCPTGAMRVLTPEDLIEAYEQKD